MNKSFIFVFALLIATTIVHAQTSSGDMMVGGSISFSSYSREGGSLNDYSSFSFSPSFGYFISDNLAVGTSLTLATSRTGTGSAKTTGNSFGLGPFARYYKFTSDERFAFFGQAGFSFLSGKTDPAFGNVTNHNAISFSIFPGAAYFFNEHWAMELSIRGFEVVSEDPDTDSDNDKTTTVNFSIHSFSPALGLRYHF
ncbi:MAG: outer membrane beta-barrel protein [Cyclobacteriaceae bacterium]